VRQRAAEEKLFTNPSILSIMSVSQVEMNREHAGFRTKSAASICLHLRPTTCLPKSSEMGQASSTGDVSSILDKMSIWGSKEQSPVYRPLPGVLNLEEVIS
jgi:hypothetical protein